MRKVIIIGSGFSGLSAACYLGKAGYKVDVFEKNETIGGRARQLTINGFKFDMGPTFYWMPDIFENFFVDFNRKTSDYYQLIRLDPSYQVCFGQNNSLSLSANLDEIFELFEREEPGSSRFLRDFLGKGKNNYETAVKKVIYKPGKNILELIMPETILSGIQFIESISKRIRKNIKNPKLQQILEFPVLFLGAKPSKTPLFYCFMNYADMGLGTWHIKGGMFELVKAMQQLAEEYGVTFHSNMPVEKIVVENKKATGVIINKQFYSADLVISSADYHYTECLIDKENRNYSEKYWRKRVFAPSALLYYVGFDKKLKNLSHHTLFFDADFEQHAINIYDKKAWPTNPLFYASFPSLSDEGIAPEGNEAGIFLIPIAPGLKDTPKIRKFYFEQIIDRLEKNTGQSLKNSILFSHSYAGSDFVNDYHAYKGNAYGLANILSQTAFLKPKLQNRKISNLFYTGQLTVPGPGVPPAIISGKIVSELAINFLKQ